MQETSFLHSISLLYLLFFSFFFIFNTQFFFLIFYSPYSCQSDFQPVGLHYVRHTNIYLYDLYDVLPFLGNRMLLHSFIYPSFPTMKANMEYKFERRNVNDEEIALQKNRERDLSNQLLGCRKTKNKFFSFFFNVYIRTCTYMYVV